MPNLVILDPCDAHEIEQVVPAIAAHDGPVYMRLLRGNVPLVLDEYNYQFELGKAKLLRDGNDALIISSGFMTMRALETVELLRQDGVEAGVLHVPTIKPLDEATILEQAKRSGGMVVVAEITPSWAGSGKPWPACCSVRRDPASLPAGGPSGRVPRRRSLADAARPLRHLGQRHGRQHQGLAVAPARSRCRSLCRAP